MSKQTELGTDKPFLIFCINSPMVPVNFLARKHNLFTRKMKRIFDLKEVTTDWKYVDFDLNEDCILSSLLLNFQNDGNINKVKNLFEFRNKVSI